MWFKSFVLGELSFVTMPLSCNCMKMNEIQFWNCLPKLGSLYPVTAMWCGDSRWNDPKFGIPKNVQFWHICGSFSFWSNFGWPKIWVIPCWVTTPLGCHWVQWTNSGCQLHEWILFIFKQYCLEGILAKESSPRTKDFLLCRDLQV